ncbi:MAG: hypothetical protein R3224_10915, partial [Balneolaceae bacterium]|nr:hypothetical protein [Balneolaceae bacterium]
ITLLAAGVICLGTVGLAAGQQAPLNELLEQARDAGIEQSTLEELRSRAENRGMSQQELGTVIESAVSLAENNLPTEHLTQKALEGLSKGVPAPRIVSYIQQVRSSTGQAARIVDPWMDNDGVRRMVDRSGGSVSGPEMRNSMIKVSTMAIAQDIPAESIDRLLSDINDESVLSRTTAPSVVAAISILPDLPGAEQAQTARTFVVRALKSGFNTADLQKLPTALNMAQQRSRLPAATILEGVAGQMRGGTPAAQILQNLFDGNIGGGPAGNVPKGLENVPDQAQGGRNGNGGTI